MTDIEGLERRGKLVVEVGFIRRGQVTNAVVSGGLVPVENLRDRAQYDVISGEL